MTFENWLNRWLSGNCDSSMASQVLASRRRRRRTGSLAALAAQVRIERLESRCLLTPVISGMTYSGEINAPLEVQEYTFTADAGDKMLLNLARTSGDLEALVEVTGPDSSVLFSGVASEFSLTLEDLGAGLHTISVSDGLLEGSTGGFDLTFVKIPGAHLLPAGEGAFTSGATKIGEIAPGDIDVYTFTIAPGAKGLLNLARTDGEFQPWVQIFSESGTEIYSSTQAEHSLSFTSVPPGTYTLTVRDNAALDGTTGEYALTFVQAPGTHLLPPGEGALASGENVPESITPGDIDVFTFGGNAGDVVQLQLVRTSGDMQPWVQIFTPAGEVIYNSTSPLQDQSLNLFETGTYTLTVRDTAALPGATGDYSLTVSGFTGSVPVNAPPVLENFGPDLNYLVGGAPILISDSVTVTDADSPNFAGGKLWVTLPGSLQPGDRLAIRNEGSDPGQIGLSGGNVTFGGTVIGTLDAAALVVTFNAQATPEAVEALLRNLVFWNTNENPNTLPRTVRVQLTDGDSLVRATVTKTINVVVTNVPPSIGSFGPAVAYGAGMPPVLISPNATVFDIDSPNFAGGTLWVSLGETAQPGDRLGIRNQGTGAGQIGFLDGQVTYNGVLIGTVDGAALTVNFNSSATPAAVQALLRNLTFWNNTSHPDGTPRTVKVQLNDGDSNVRTTVSKTIQVLPVNLPPVINHFGPDIEYPVGGNPIIIDGNATVTDADSPNFAGGMLWVTFAETGLPGDRLSIRHQGTGPGQIGFLNGQVLYGGTVIGTQQGQALVIQFNQNATAEAVQALIRSLNYWNTDPNAVTGPRTIRVQLSDGDSNVRTTVEKILNVV